MKAAVYSRHGLPDHGLNQGRGKLVPKDNKVSIAGGNEMTISTIDESQRKAAKIAGDRKSVV